MTFELVRTPLQNGPRRVAVAAIVDLAPGYRRIVLEGDFAGFASLGADDHLRIFFVPDGVAAEDFEQMRAFPSREYTPVAWDDSSLVLDFVIHGEGPASSWAAAAEPGAVAMVGGPRGSLVVEGRTGWRLLAGDRTALPAIRRFAAEAAPGEPVDVVLLAEDPAEEQSVESPGELSVSWVRDLDALVAAIGSLPVREGEGLVFVAAEQSVVRPARRLLLDRGVALERAIVKGYWKRGEAEYHAPHGTAAETTAVH